ncbi:hypothetical protein BLIJ_1269 [Bifidobacterium longum subsp. infantis ATCC 15697 = JCM 1222 = DSM 20088]|nr:hypothetical protein BLIJ_1269 [Bifidobacterium longum subsp. infantis ATCC 15697 = JCM 1222 = DSM 20088]
MSCRRAAVPGMRTGRPSGAGLDVWAVGRVRRVVGPEAGHGVPVFGVGPRPVHVQPVSPEQGGEPFQPVLVFHRGTPFPPEHTGRGRRRQYTDGLFCAKTVRLCTVGMRGLPVGQSVCVLFSRETVRVCTVGDSPPWRPRPHGQSVCVLKSSKTVRLCTVGRPSSCPPGSWIPPYQGRKGPKNSPSMYCFRAKQSVYVLKYPKTVRQCTVFAPMYACMHLYASGNAYKKSPEKARKPL